MIRNENKPKEIQKMKSRIEHINFTLKDPLATAGILGDLFGWRIRWQGDAIAGGFTVHVGTETDYFALYTGPGGKQTAAQNNYSQLGGLNHVGIVVDDLDAVEVKVLAAGFRTTNHGDYEPGRRFYFHDTDGIEFEIVSYD